MEDWTKKTDEDVFRRPGEELGSQASYWRDIEIKRRNFLLAKEVAEAQIAAAKATEEAVAAQVRAAEATEKTALWTRVSAVAMALSVVAIVGGYFVSK
ncbi:hypothetical protein ACFOHK_01085 [Falsigemmobacter intermedius]|uniref:Uncharacterized protein n=1 Tax=Falsigemmobacter intermedius TaxID=1553448 RepID=A0A451GH26_9RHOB|nr:hypothetical protein [Falsigemmobacter intermedius]RWY37349.1 hypothetical protein EP867_17340 [Falsigemmobacter intermedius]